jgi:hypothetical protein
MKTQEEIKDAHSKLVVDMIANPKDLEEYLINVGEARALAWVLGDDKIILGE